MSNSNKDIALIKSLLLAKATIKFADSTICNLKRKNENLHRKEWIFFRLNESSRVRLIYDDKAELLLIPSQGGSYEIFDTITNTIIIKNVKIEKALLHAPEQLFFVIYKKCVMGCKFCPLSISIDNYHCSLDRVYSHLRIVEQNEIKSIGLTSALPPNLSESDVVEEIVFLIEKIRQRIKSEIPIGVSIKTPSKDDLRQLKRHGVSEVRLNLEVYNDELSQTLMPLKRKDKILHSIQDACDVFGDGHVSSNMIVGIGENDEDLIGGIEMLASLGAVATLYPYDPVDGENIGFIRPSSERLYSLAIEQKKIFERYKINPLRLQTMCCSCAASHIFPGRDL